MQNENQTFVIIYGYVSQSFFLNTSYPFAVTHDLFNQSIIVFILIIILSDYHSFVFVSAMCLLQSTIAAFTNID